MLTFGLGPELLNSVSKKAVEPSLLKLDHLLKTILYSPNHER